MPASLAALSSHTAAAQNVASGAVGAGVLAGLGGDVSSAFAGLIDAQQTDQTGAAASPGDAAAAAVDAQTNTGGGANPLTTVTMPTALLGFLTQAQTKTDAKDAIPTSGQTAPTDAKANDAAATMLSAVAGQADPAKAPPKSATANAGASVSVPLTKTGAPEPTVQTAQTAVATQAKDGAGAKAAKADRDKSSSTTQTATVCAPDLAGLLGIVQSAPLQTPSAAVLGDASGSDVALGDGTTASPGQLVASTDDDASEPPPTGFSMNADSAAGLDTKGATALQSAPSSQTASSTGSPISSADARSAAAGAASTQAQNAVDLAGVAAPPATAPQAAAPASPQGAGSSPSVDTAASAQAGAASASAAARFAPAKSTAATNFKAAPTSARSTTGPQASAPTSATASASSTAASAGPHAVSRSGDDHADPLSTDTGEGVAATVADNTAISPDAVPTLAAASTDAAATPLAAPAASAPASSGAETAANLSAQIVQKMAGQNTRFDVQLNPNGLGRVDVAVQIDAKGALSASLSFEKPEAASLLHAHAADLQQSLTQAGFDLSNTSLSFSTADQNGRGSQQSFFAGDFSGGQNANTGQGGGQSAGRAFSAASLAAAQTDATALQSQGLSARGVDIRI